MVTHQDTLNTRFHNDMVHLQYQMQQLQIKFNDLIHGNAYKNQLDKNIAELSVKIIDIERIHQKMKNIEKEVKKKELENNLEKCSATVIYSYNSILDKLLNGKANKVRRCQWRSDIYIELNPDKSENQEPFIFKSVTNSEITGNPKVDLWDMKANNWIIVE